MLVPGSKLKHVKSPSFVNEMVDSFNITAVHTGHGAKLMMSVGRDYVDVISETFVEKDGGIVTEGRPEDSELVRYSVANLCIPMDSARSLMKTLQETIEAYDAQIATLTAQQAK